MKRVLKLALKNIVAIPQRTFIYFSIVFITVLTVVVCFTLYSVGNDAGERFERDYATVATVYPKTISNEVGTATVRSGAYLSFDDLASLRSSDTVAAYGFSILCGSVPDAEIISRLPGEWLLEKEPQKIIKPTYYSLYAVENLMLLDRFFRGDSVITEGAPFSDTDVRRAERVAIISQTVAEHHGLHVGDDIVFDMKDNCFVIFKITGIYSSKLGLNDCYIPFSTFSKLYGAMHSNTYVTDSERRYRITRMDFLLNDVNGGGEFISDAINNGLDIGNFDIAVNDRQYKIAMNGISSLCNVSAVVFVSVLCAGVALVVLISFFYSAMRQKERHVLRALGIKDREVSGMMLTESAIIIAFSLLAGMAAGIPASRLAVLIADEQQTESTKTEISYSVIDPFDKTPEMTLQRDMDFSLFGSADSYISENIIPYRRAIASEDEVAHRYERFWVYKTNEEITVLGITKADINDFSNVASNPYSLTKDFSRKRGYTFDCYVSEHSQYNVGDIIYFYASPEGTIVRVTADGQFNQERKIYFAFKVAGTYTGDYDADVVVAMEEMELLCDCVYLHSDGYNNDRYDLLVRKEEND